MAVWESNGVRHKAAPINVKVLSRLFNSNS